VREPIDELLADGLRRREPKPVRHRIVPGEDEDKQVVSLLPYGAGTPIGQAAGCSAIDRPDRRKASEKHMPSSAPWALRAGKMASTIFTEPQA